MARRETETADEDMTLPAPQYKPGDAGPPRPGSAPRADADEIDETLPLDVYKVGDAGPQRPSSGGRKADADERTESTAGRSPPPREDY